MIDQNGEKHPRWCPMGKSVEHFWRYAQVAEGANRRLIDALAPLKGEATQELDELCRSRDRDGTRVARFNPIDAQTLFIAVLSSPSPGSAIATSRPSCSTRHPEMIGRPDAEPTGPPV